MCEYSKEDRDMLHTLWRTIHGDPKDPKSIHDSMANRMERIEYRDRIALWVLALAGSTFIVTNVTHLVKIVLEN
jgi:hypothetical protein